MVVSKLLSAFLLLSISGLQAGGPEPLRSELFFVPAPLPIRYQSYPDKEGDVHERTNVAGTWKHNGRFSIAPEFHGKLRHLGEGTLYDLCGILRDEWGLTLPEGSLAVVGPDAKLLFLRSTPADLKLAEACLESSVRLPQAISFDVQITEKSAAHGEQRLFLGKAIGAQSGQKTELSSYGGTGESAHKVELGIEAVNDPSGTSVQVDLAGSVSRGSSHSRITTQLAAEFGKEVRMELSLNGDTEVTLQFTFRQKILGLPAPLESAATKKQAIADIEADLLDASGAIQ